MIGCNLRGHAVNGMEFAVIAVILCDQDGDDSISIAAYQIVTTVLS